MNRFNENVEMMLVRRGNSKKQLIDHLGISKSAFYSKIAGVNPWYLDEAVKVAEFFGVGVDDLL